MEEWHAHTHSTHSLTHRQTQHSTLSHRYPPSNSISRSSSSGLISLLTPPSLPLSSIPLSTLPSSASSSSSSCSNGPSKATGAVRVFVMAVEAVCVRRRFLAGSLLTLSVGSDLTATCMLLLLPTTPSSSSTSSFPEECRVVFVACVSSISSISTPSPSPKSGGG